MSLIINPGTGPVAAATAENAQRNMCVFVDDVSRQFGGSVKFESLHHPDDGRDGRWQFAVEGERVGRHDVWMPGCPIGIATGEDCPSIFDQPRLYVNGSSWLWGFAVDMCYPHGDAS